MQTSRFVVTWRDAQPGEHILYSVLSDRYLGVDDATLEAIARWSGGAAPDGEAEVDTATLLLEEGFLVDSRSVDDERLRDHLDRAAGGIPNTLYVTLLPTLACNIACTYCFQKDSPAFTRMDSKSETASVGWILGQAEASGCRKLIVHYFGGEPLTRKDFLLRTAAAFRTGMVALGGEFEWEITTNGIHLDLEFVLRLKEFGSGSVKVTLDGDKETHDQVRVYRDGRPTFDTIFSNLMAAADHIPIRVGGNFRAGQADSYQRLLERMTTAGVISKLEGVRFKPVVDTSRAPNGTCTGCSHADPRETQALVQINRAVEKHWPGAGERQSLDDMLGPCELHWNNSYVIDPEGDLYKCPAVAGRKEMAVGSVHTGRTREVAPLLEFRPWEQCGDCAYMPVCVGGCLGGAYLKTGRLDQVFCQKEAFEVTFREAISRQYLNELGDQAWDDARRRHPEHETVFQD
jgi:uncharacterized protein